MATTKTLNTRIQLKYDSYENWMKDAAVELLAGEIAVCTISTDENNSAGANDKIQNPPTVLFKVGPGKFKDLKWASALAADVHDWAKLSYADFLTELQKTVYTETEVNDLIAAAEGRAATDAKNKADAAEANAKAHAESQASAAQSAAISAAAGDATEKANKALADAKTYTDEEINKIVTGSGYATTSYVDGKVAGEAEARAKAITDEHTLISAEIDADVKVATDAIAAMDEAYKAADATLKSNLEGQISAAKQEISGEVTSLANGTVKANTDAITKLNGNSTVEGSVDKKISDALNDFMSKETADDVVNTYKELIDYAAAHGAEAIEMAAAIDNLEKSLAEGGATANAIAEAKQAGLDAQDAVDNLIMTTVSGSDDTTNPVEVTATDDGTNRFFVELKSASVSKGYLDSGVQASLGLADTAVQPAALNDYQPKGDYQPAGNYKTVQEAVAETGAADKTLKISQDANGVITATPIAIAIEQSQVNSLVNDLASKANDADLAAIAKTGNVNDLVQGTNDVLVFNCGSASTVF